MSPARLKVACPSPQKHAADQSQSTYDLLAPIDTAVDPRGSLSPLLVQLLPCNRPMNAFLNLALVRYTPQVLRRIGFRRFPPFHRLFQSPQILPPLALVPPAAALELHGLHVPEKIHHQPLLPPFFPAGEEIPPHAGP